MKPRFGFMKTSQIAIFKSNYLVADPYLTRRKIINPDAKRQGMNRK